MHASKWEKRKHVKGLHFAIFLTLGKFQFSKRKSLIDHDDSDNINNKHQLCRSAKHQLGMCITLVPSHLIWLFILKKAWCKCFSHIFTRALENVVCLGESRLSQVSNSPRADVFPARLAMMLNFNISKVVYLSRLSTEREKILTSGCHFWHPGLQPSSCLYTKAPNQSLVYHIFLLGIGLITAPYCEFLELA